MTLAGTSFLLSPADLGGRRAKILLAPAADFPLAHRIREGGAPLGEVFSFLSGLYFRGKLAYARRFASSPAEGIRVITTNRGLLSPDILVTVRDLIEFGATDIGADDSVYREAVSRDAVHLPAGRIVLLGSLATRKYLALLGEILGERLYYPREFVGLGDMSRGAMLLDAVEDERELDYSSAANLRVPSRSATRGRSRRADRSRDDDLTQPVRAIMPRKSTGSNGDLHAYRKKRDFARTAEPKPRRRVSGPRLSFVIQKHAASTLHFDLRLELDGVMKSWAVPKGPSLDPSVKRLAVEVEDHPVDYNAFEGTIPAGEYGGGTVMIWDRGTYRYAGDDSDPIAGLRAGLAAGTVEFSLAGRRLKGGWVLVRTRKQGRARQWLLIKRHDRFADETIDPTERYQTSVVSRRTMERIAAEE